LGKTKADDPAAFIWQAARTISEYELANMVLPCTATNPKLGAADIEIPAPIKEVATHIGEPNGVGF